MTALHGIGGLTPKGPVGQPWEAKTLAGQKDHQIVTSNQIEPRVGLRGQRGRWGKHLLPLAVSGIWEQWPLYKYIKRRGEENREGDRRGKGEGGSSLDRKRRQEGKGE